MKATLPSNKGNASLTIDIGSPRVFKGEAGVDATVDISKLNWTYRGPLPCNLSVAGLWLRVTVLVDLHKCISKWLKLPLGELAATELLGDFDLAGEPGQSFLLRFEPRDDTISERHPVISIVLDTSAFRADAHFVTDPSCLALFASELGYAITTCEPVAALQ